MANITTQPKFSVAIRSEKYQQLINNTLGDKKVAQKFIADITSVVSNNYMLANCDAGSILSAGLMAQSLNLPLSSSLGFAYVVPYGNKAQFQIGWKGFVQLALRTGQYKKMGVMCVHEGEYLGMNEFGEDLVKFSHDFDNKPVVGYFAYFEMVNGFVKTFYWTKEQCDKHAHTYSKSYGSGKATDNWKNNFDAMAMKTVIKQLLSKWAIMSVELEKAIISDQAVINENGSVEYVDNEPAEIEQDAPKTNIANSILPDEETGEVKEETSQN